MGDRAGQRLDEGQRRRFGVGRVLVLGLGEQAAVRERHQRRLRAVGERQHMHAALEGALRQHHGIGKVARVADGDEHIALAHARQHARAVGRAAHAGEQVHVVAMRVQPALQQAGQPAARAEARQVDAARAQQRLHRRLAGGRVQRLARGGDIALALFQRGGEDVAHGRGFFQLDAHLLDGRQHGLEALHQLGPQHRIAVQAHGPREAVRRGDGHPHRRRQFIDRHGGRLQRMRQHVVRHLLVRARQRGARAADADRDRHGLAGGLWKVGHGQEMRCGSRKCVRKALRKNLQRRHIKEKNQSFKAISQAHPHGAAQHEKSPHAVHGGPEMRHAAAMGKTLKSRWQAVNPPGCSQP
ncbi:hypothetical protein QRO09_12360 [Paracidovorax citrulli]|nr:hypothetical protein [Paracidovorax citrulli]WIY27871.1 hypothetical protein QRO09_12360 [Paracidovorax citrulli]